MDEADPPTERVKTKLEIMIEESKNQEPCMFCEALDSEDNAGLKCDSCGRRITSGE